MNRALPVLLLALLTCACSTDSGAGRPTPSSSPSGVAGSPTASPTSSVETEPSSSLTGRPDAAEQARLDARVVVAARERDVDEVRRLVARGADVNAQDERLESAFLLAASEGPLQMLELTLRAGGDIDAHDSFDGTALIRAAERGLADVTGRLLREGVALDHVNELGWTALHEAVILGDGGPRYVDTVRVLVAAGVDVALPARRDGLTAEQHARRLGQDPVAALLSQAERPLPRSRADEVLLRAARGGDADTAALALRAGANLEARDARRRTPLLLAVADDRLAVARLLIHLGSDPDARDDRQDTPWLVTGVTGSVPMLELLLPARPDLTLRNRFGGVSVIPASERGHVGYVRRVVRTDIDVDHVNDLGWTALLEAVILGDGGPRHQEIVRILLAAGADPTIPDREGVTALEHAESRGYDEIAATLRRAT